MEDHALIKQKGAPSQPCKKSKANTNSPTQYTECWTPSAATSKWIISTPTVPTNSHFSSPIAMKVSPITSITEPVDHLTGLTFQPPHGSSYWVPRTDWCFGKIYCSEVSAEILLQRFPHLSNYVHPLKLQTEYIIRKRKVRLIPANHCPGAVMFFISTDEYTLLHTGDFRYRPIMGEQIKQQMSLLKTKKIDRVYMDNTFATSAESFPSQQEAFGKICEIVKKHRLGNSNMKFFFYCYTLGKEEVFWNLAEHYHTKVQMLKDRFVKCQQAGLGDQHFVTKGDHNLQRDGPIFLFVKPMRDRPTAPDQIEKKKDIVHIVLTGWKGQYNVNHPRYYKVPYSSHSSPDDLEDFLRLTNPEKLVFNLKNKAQKQRDDFQLRLVTKYTTEGKEFIKEAPDCQEKVNAVNASTTQTKLAFSPSTQRTTLSNSLEEEQKSPVRQGRQEHMIEFLEIDDVLADPLGTNFRQKCGKKRTTPTAVYNEESSECPSIPEGISEIQKADLGQCDTPKIEGKRMKLEEKANHGQQVILNFKTAKSLIQQKHIRTAQVKPIFEESQSLECEQNSQSDNGSERQMKAHNVKGLEDQSESQVKSKSEGKLSAGE